MHNIAPCRLHFNRLFSAVFGTPTALCHHVLNQRRLIVINVNNKKPPLPWNHTEPVAPF